MVNSIRLLILLSLFVFLAYGEVNSPIEAQGESTSVETAPAFMTYTARTPKSLRTIITGYSSSYDETDDSPWITAAGTYTRDGIAASNFLPIGSKIRIPKLFGGKVFVVEDRLNNRFYDRVDIWFSTKWEARNFGIHYNTLIEVLE